MHKQIKPYHEDLSGLQHSDIYCLNCGEWIGAMTFLPRGMMTCSCCFAKNYFDGATKATRYELRTRAEIESLFGKSGSSTSPSGSACTQPAANAHQP